MMKRASSVSVVNKAVRSVLSSNEVVSRHRSELTTTVASALRRASRPRLCARDLWGVGEPLWLGASVFVSRARRTGTVSQAFLTRRGVRTTIVPAVMVRCRRSDVTSVVGTFVRALLRGVSPDEALGTMSCASSNDEAVYVAVVVTRSARRPGLEPFMIRAAGRFRLGHAVIVRARDEDGTINEVIKRLKARCALGV